MTEMGAEVGPRLRGGDFGWLGATSVCAGAGSPCKGGRGEGVEHFFRIGGDEL